MCQVALKDPSTVDQAASDLSAWEGVDVFRKEDIPDHFGLRNNDLVLDLLLVSLGDQIISQDFEYSDAFLPFPVPSGEGILLREFFFSSELAFSISLAFSQTPSWRKTKVTTTPPQVAKVRMSVRPKKRKRDARSQSSSPVPLRPPRSSKTTREPLPS